MSTALRVTPIDFGQDGTPRDGKLYEAFQEYCKKQLGAELSCGYYLRCWAVLMSEEGCPESYQVIGATALRTSIDVQVFHVTAPTPDKPGLRLAEQARDLIVYRLWSHLEDCGQRGSTVLVYVSEQAQRYWRKFLAKIKARPANRFEVTI